MMRWKLIVYLLIATCVAFVTYFHNYSYPPNLFWDENYHIASAEKYIQGVFFMSDHPPLGKLLIAAGEKIINPNKNINKSAFVTTDYIKDIPKGYSFAGVRFFPALFAMLAAPLFFMVLYNLTGYSFLSFLLSSLYLFENAYIVHSRGAMLEGIQMFFIMLFLCQASRMMRKREDGGKREEGGILKVEDRMMEWGLLGVLFGLIIATKLNGVVFGLMPIFILALRKPKLKWAIQALTLFGISAFLIFSLSYFIHFTLTPRVVDNRYYEASKQYKLIINKPISSTRGRSPFGRNYQLLSTIKNFPIMFKEHIQFIFHYEKGVPVYDACKDEENGSLPATWPFGNKSINYRWEKDNNAMKYLYLQGNPLIWFFGFVSVILTFVHITSVMVFGASVKNKHHFKVLTILFSLYVCYMALVMSITRVMYLYHYFIPLLLSLIMGALLIAYLFENRLKRGFTNAYFIIILFVLLVVIVYLFFRPFSYYLPLTQAQFELRNWSPFWGLKPVAN